LTFSEKFNPGSDKKGKEIVYHIKMVYWNNLLKNRLLILNKEMLKNPRNERLKRKTLGKKSQIGRIGGREQGFIAHLTEG